MNTLQENVERGAAWLDERKPGWLSLIKVDSLDMLNSDYCVMGQCGLNYDDEVYDLHPERSDPASCRWALEHGFLLSFASEYEAEELTDAWRKFITERRKNRA